MPELPEVETIKRQLVDNLIGEVVTHVAIRTPKMVRGDLNLLLQASIVDVRRFSKLLSIDFSNQLSLTIHLKMTGRLVLDSKISGQSKLEWDVDYPQDRHTHLTIGFQSGSFLYFNDYRKFGVLEVMPTEAVIQTPYVQSLGKEFFKNLNLNDFVDILKVTKRTIKTVLLDQSKIAGVGNIYANEALWKARVHPELSANSLTTKQAKQLFSALETVMLSAIDHLGASSDNFRNLFGQPGQAQDHFAVYGRQGQPCLRCGATLVKIFVGQRGTYICEHCQQLDK